MGEKFVITLDQKQILELKAIIIDRDKEDAFKFLYEYIYKPTEKKEQGHCKPQI